MKNILIVDTNFLINNIGNIQEIVKEFNEKQIEIYVPELVKEEFINIQLRKLDEKYNKLESLKNLKEILNLKYRKKEDAAQRVETIYNRLFEKHFENKIIGYNKDNMLDRVLERNKYKQPPFYNENNSSDKGFKDTIILLSIIDFVNDFQDEAVFYFVTSDNGFIKYKNEIEKEIFEKCKKNIIIVGGKERDKVYKEIGINKEREEQDEGKNNIFSEQDLNIEEIRKKINELMDTFIWKMSWDYYGNPEEIRRFEISSYINKEDTEKFLNGIDVVIEDNIFRNEILLESFFENKEWNLSKNSIETDVMREISQLYKKVKDTRYKEPFINYITQKINENKVNNMFTVESVDDLPF